MTFSIVARSDDGTRFGIGVASKFLAVGAIVPAAEAGIGALATQAFANVGFRTQGMELLRTGVEAARVVDGLMATDPGRAQRQLGVVDNAGRAASFTGDACYDWAGGITADGVAIQGNILAGPQVVEAMSQTWHEQHELPFARRLLATLQAGDLAGGDRRGRESAALYVVENGQGYGGTSDVSVDLRIDDHADPVGELDRLLQLHQLYFDPPDLSRALPLSDATADEVRGLLERVGQPVPNTPNAVDDALVSWAGIANLETRMLPGRIDRLVLQQLRIVADECDITGTE